MEKVVDWKMPLASVSAAVVLPPATVKWVMSTLGVIVTVDSLNEMHVLSKIGLKTKYSSILS